jgi:two-component system response regulator NreC
VTPAVFAAPRAAVPVPGPAPSAIEPPESIARTTVRLLLVDDHHLVREGLRLVLAGAAGIEVVGEAGTVSEAFEAVELAKPDVVVLDLTLPDGDGIPLIQGLRARHPALRILVLTMHRDAETVRQAFIAGAAGFVVKGARSAELLSAVWAVMRGERYLHSSVAGPIVNDSLQWAITGSQLSVREREILGLLAAGNTAPAVGRLLGISPHTVRRHIANLSQKLQLHGIAALTRYARDHGLAREA